MGIFGTIKTAVSGGMSRADELIERRKRSIAADKLLNEEIRRTEDERRFKKLIAEGMQPSVALRQIEYERTRQMREPMPDIRPATVRPSSFKLGIEQQQKNIRTGKAKGLGINWSGIAGNIVQNAEKGFAGFGSGQQPKSGHTKKVHTGYDIWGNPIIKEVAVQKKAHISKPIKMEKIRGYDMWGRPLYELKTSERTAPKKKKGLHIIGYDVRGKPIYGR